MLHWIKRTWARRCRKIDEDRLFPEFRKVVDRKLAHKKLRDEAYTWMVLKHKSIDWCWRQEFD